MGDMDPKLTVPDLEDIPEDDAAEPDDAAVSNPSREELDEQ